MVDPDAGTPVSGRDVIEDVLNSGVGSVSAGDLRNAAGDARSTTCEAMIYQSGGTYYALDRFGDTIDSGADVGSLINSAVAAINSGTIWIGEGVFELSTMAHIDKDAVSLIGSGMRGGFDANADGTIIKLADGTDVEAILKTTGIKTKMKNFAIGGNKSNQTTLTNGIKTDAGSASDTNIQDVYLHNVNTGTTGGGTIKATVKINGMHGNLEHVYAEDSDAGRAFRINGNRWSFRNCYSYNDTASNYEIGFDIVGQENELTGCLVLGTSSHAYKVAGQNNLVNCRAIEVGEALRVSGNKSNISNFLGKDIQNSAVVVKGLDNKLSNIYVRDFSLASSGTYRGFTLQNNENLVLNAVAEAVDVTADIGFHSTGNDNRMNNVRALGSLNTKYDRSSGTRTVINGVSMNSGNPSTGGEWNGNAQLAYDRGILVWNESVDPPVGYIAHDDVGTGAGWRDLNTTAA